MTTHTLPNAFDKCHDQAVINHIHSFIIILIRAPSWLRLIPRTRTRQLGTRFGRSGFFAFGNKMVIVITVVVVVDAQVEQSAQTVLDGID